MHMGSKGLCARKPTHDSKSFTTSPDTCCLCFFRVPQLCRWRALHVCPSPLLASGSGV